MDENNFDPAACPLEEMMDVVGGKWKAVILWHLFKGPRRFSVLRKSIPGVSQKMLTQQLRELEIHGLIDRRVYDDSPPRVEYWLTDLGKSFQPIHEAMIAWWSQHRSAIEGR